MVMRTNHAFELRPMMSPQLPALRNPPSVGPSVPCGTDDRHGRIGLAVSHSWII